MLEHEKIQKIMHNIKKYDEFNEGFANKLATIALGGAMALSAPSCIQKGEVRIEQTQTKMQKRNSDEFNTYELRTRYETYKISFSNSKKVISTSYTVTIGKNTWIRRTLYISKDINFIYVDFGFWDSYMYATDNPKYANVDGFETIDISQLEIDEENEFCIIYNTGFWDRIRKIYVDKGRKSPNDFELTTDLNGLKLGLIDADGYDCWIKIK